MSPSGAYSGWARSEIYVPGRHLATYQDGTTYFAHLDPLGTERLRSKPDGSLYETCVSLPFGDGQNCSFPNGAGTDSPLHFTGKPRDPETGLDDFGARLYSSSLGRWMTPDWSAQAEPVPYAKLDNPQSLNLYAYVLNNPVTSVDPDGHCALGLFGHDCTVYQRVTNLFTGKGWRTDAELAKVTTVTVTTGVVVNGRYFPDRTLPNGTKGQPVPDSPNPHTQRGIKSSKSGELYGQARELDSKGNPVKRIDFTDHGHPEQHPDPHEHKFDPARGWQEPEPVGGVPEQPSQPQMTPSSSATGGDIIEPEPFLPEVLPEIIE